MDTKTLTLAEFLLARIGEDEAYARNAYANHNDNGPQWSEIWSGAVDLGGSEHELLITNDSAVSRHIERHDPARVLADCEAKRRIVERYVTYCDRVGEDYRSGDDYDLGNRNAAFFDVRDLATVYADHPDYRDEWRP